jgi:eukaryotic-like serine/threonine-protein kinase
VYPSTYKACPRDGAALTEADPLIGTVLGDRYRVERLIGEGGLGRVYLAKHLRLSRRYAVKVPRGAKLADETARARFALEADAASRLDHPNVASAIDAGETAGGLLYLVMDFAEGESLRRRLVRAGRLPAGEALGIARQIALGLDHAHTRGLIHRDLKPDHVVLDAGGRARVVDFGIAILAELGESGRYTTKGIVLGTPEYMAPEQACGEPLDARCDLFALGIVLYEMIGGCLPFDGDSVAIATRLVNDEIPDLSVRVPGLVVDPTIAQLCRWLTAKRPSDRPQRATDVVLVIDQILAALDAPPPAFARRRQPSVPPRARGVDGWPRLQSWLTTRHRSRPSSTAPPH